MASEQVVELEVEQVEGREETIEQEELEPYMKPGAGELVVPGDYDLKHPLQHAWALWFFKNDRTKHWSDNLRKVTTFDTVEDFWGLFNHVQPASKLQLGCDYCLFKEGITPMWEDTGNVKGGRWLINLNKSERFKFLDSFWLETSLCLIGEAFEDASDDICGAVVQLRNKGDKIGIWTSNWNNPDGVMRIGRKLKDRLNVPKSIVITYQSHVDSAKKSGSTARNTYTV